MNILIYSDLNSNKVRKQFDRTVALLAAGDFRAADVKKLAGTPYYRAKLNDTDRLLFRFASHHGASCLLLLEIIANHAYEKSRFLRGHATIDEAKLQPLADPDKVPTADRAVLPYLNPKSQHFHLLDKILSFDDAQNDALLLQPPLILIGSAGSGKTVLTLEKIKQLTGEVLYVTHSPFLVENSRNLYYANGYENDDQELDFLSFRELLETIEIPDGKPMDFNVFLGWFNRHRGSTPIKDAHKLYEEFNGVLTGAPTDKPHLSREAYLDLGIRRSIFTGTERVHVYDLFLKYLVFLKDNGYFDLNLEAFRNLGRAPASYDFVVVDEVQDLTNVQVMLILRHLRRPDRFLLCGDSNQIVHPNFFSWANVKTMFYEKRTGGRKEIVRILCVNYRNSPQVTSLANRLLCIKHARFGSIDRESNYLVRSVGSREGTVEFLKDDEKTRKELDRRTARSARFAVLVLRPEDKEAVKCSFHTPLVFSIQEAKGLEYENIILCDLVGGAAREFMDITEGVVTEDLDRERLDYSRGRDKSDKSMEALKFYVNALYVAVTRSVCNLYIVDGNPEHRLFQLLGLQISGRELGVKAQESSVDEWKAEATRLEKQGKKDQADAIRRTILGTQNVPWQVLTKSNLSELEGQALDPASYNRKAKILLFEYAITYNRAEYYPLLASLKFSQAADPGKSIQQVEQKYTQDYREKSYRELTRKLNLYGVDFRNPLNQTPLMLATQLGKVDLLRALKTSGANPELRDNLNRTSLNIALDRAAQSVEFRQTQFGTIYEELEKKPLRLKIGDRLVRLDPHTMEYFLFNLVYSSFWPLLNSNKGRITAAFLEGILAGFPGNALPDYRKRRPYISSILAKNEIRKLASHNRQLFARLRHGIYIPNPEICIDIDGQWHNLFDLVGVPSADQPSLTGLQRYLFNLKIQASEFIMMRLREYNQWRLEQNTAKQDALALKANDKATSTIPGAN